MRLLALCILVVSLVPLSSAVADLSGQSGKDALNSIESGSSLWNWGSAPLGHVVDDSQLISGVRKIPWTYRLWKHRSRPRAWIAVA